MIKIWVCKPVTSTLKQPRTEEYLTAEMIQIQTGWNGWFKGSHQLWALWSQWHVSKLFLKEILLFEGLKWKDIYSSSTTKPQETQSKNWLRHGKTPPWRRHTEETRKSKMNIQYHFLLGSANPNHNEISPYNQKSDLYHKKWEQVSVSMRVHRRTILIHCWYEHKSVLLLWKTIEYFKKWNIAQHWRLCSVNFTDPLESLFLILWHKSNLILAGATISSIMFRTSQIAFESKFCATWEKKVHVK